tara:strand:- start:1544 stop:2359 length:816 start_codon:yes stop_codon:yes gene_type:complete
MEEQPKLRYCCYCKKNKPESDFKIKKNGELTKACVPCKAKEYAAATKYRQSPKGKAFWSAFNKSPAAKAAQSRYQKTEKRKISTARHKASPKHAATLEAYAPRKKLVRAAEYKRVHEDVGRHLEHALVVKIGKMAKGVRKKSATVMSHTDFVDANDVRNHLASTFESGMSFDNFGKAKRGGPRVWNVGHRIARFHYDAGNEEDIRRCWRKDNLFAQWADENLSLHAKFPQVDKLIELCSSWPVAWNNQLPSQLERVAMERAVYARAGSWAW